MTWRKRTRRGTTLRTTTEGRDWNERQTDIRRSHLEPVPTLHSKVGPSPSGERGRGIHFHGFSRKSTGSTTDNWLLFLTSRITSNLTGFKSLVSVFFYQPTSITCWTNNLKTFQEWIGLFLDPLIKKKDSKKSHIFITHEWYLLNFLFLSSFLPF